MGLSGTHKWRDRSNYRHRTVGTSISGEPWLGNRGRGGGGWWWGRDRGHLFLKKKKKKNTKNRWGSQKIIASLLHLMSAKCPNLSLSVRPFHSASLSSPSPPLPTFRASDCGLVYLPTFSFISGPQHSPQLASTLQLLSSSVPQGSRLISVISTCNSVPETLGHYLAFYPKNVRVCVGGGAELHLSTKRPMTKCQKPAFCFLASSDHHIWWRK